MRIVIIAVMILSLAASILAAKVTSPMKRLPDSNKKIVTANKIRTVSEIKQIKFTAKPVAVKSPGISLNQTPANIDAVGGNGTAYKTGTGVVLQPAFLTDSATGSIGSIYLLSLNHDILAKLQNKEQDIEAILSFADQAHSTANTILFSGYFRSIPQGTHTYVLNCRFNGGDDLRPRIWFWAGDQQIGPDKQTVNPDTKEISIIFSYTPKDQFTDYLSTGAYIKANDSNYTYSQTVRFYYMQLVQIN